MRVGTKLVPTPFETAKSPMVPRNHRQRGNTMDSKMMLESLKDAHAIALGALESAKAKANEAEVEEKQVGKAIFDFIHERK